MSCFTQDDKLALDVIKKAFELDIIVFLDWETFYKSRANNGSKSFSLKSMTYPEYIYDPRFHETGLGLVIDLDAHIEYGHGGKFYNMQMQKLKDARADGLRIGLVAHNTVFDGAICNWRYGLEFDFYFDTMLMRKYLAAHRPSSLNACAKDEWPDDPALRKGNDLADVDGIKYEYISEEQHASLAKYCRQDVNLMRRLFLSYIPRIGLANSTELRAMHITLRGNIEPQFDIRHDLLEEVIEEENIKDGEAVVEAIEYCYEQGFDDITPKTFSSNQQYATLLAGLELRVPKKISKTTGLLTPALGKGDPEYIRLQIDNPEYAVLYKARERMKSTIAKSRAERMISVSSTFRKHGFTDACMPFFLNYYGAGQTGRWSGGQKLNQQNNTRGGKHRLSMLAPDGYQIGVCDLSNIELRVNLWFCGQEDLLENFRNDPNFDLYSDIATDIFSYKVTKKTHPDERQMGKAAALGLGFSMGWFGFQQYLASGPLGMEPMFKDDEFCRNVKNAYDVKHFAIKAMWHFLANTVMPVIVNGGELRFGPNDLYIARKDQVVLPSGRVLQYSNARYKGEETQSGVSMKVVFDSDKYDRWGKPVPKYLWHGLLIENIAQATARDILAEQLVNVDRELDEKYLGWVMGSVHDELLAALKEGNEDEAFSIMERNMSKAPEWAIGLPLANEGGYAKEYSK
ncbi:DNA polymerase [Pseudoalteromonas sp. P1-11]|uniref:DNA polymerase n=1 Tax=Pseudoalteromonas sp. P1-11 TaxID=1715254 RepID=UPI0006DC5CF3|nr:DNA polymerase [Pseudoalteromonas sp. P1-11]KPW03216.1 DNA polymerase I [Pseudoalteromonas sp. P1-11]